MKKKYALVAALTALLVLVSAAIPALAQNEAQAVDAEQPLRPALGIKAPGTAPVGEEVTITVFDRQTKEPVEGASVWAFSRDNAAELRAEIAALREEGNTPASQEDYEALMSVHGEPLGLTDGNGQVTHTFDEAGLYLLVAVKDGYFPGFAPIHIKPLRLALGIKAPGTAPVGEEVTITVFDRQTKEPVEGASVWAFSRDNAAELRAEIAALREEGNTPASQEDYEALMSVHGEPLGLTDGNGQVTHTFDEAGLYLLVAVKDGYFPGFSVIGIKVKPTASSLNGQGAATALRSAAQLRAAGSGGHRNMVRVANQVKTKRAVRAAGTVAAKARSGNAWADAD